MKDRNEVPVTQKQINDIARCLFDCLGNLSMKMSVALETLETLEYQSLAHMRMLEDSTSEEGILGTYFILSDNIDRIEKQQEEETNERTKTLTKTRREPALDKLQSKTASSRAKKTNSSSSRAKKPPKSKKKR